MTMMMMHPAAVVILLAACSSNGLLGPGHVGAAPLASEPPQHSTDIHNKALSNTQNVDHLVDSLVTDHHKEDVSPSAKEVGIQGDTEGADTDELMSRRVYSPLDSVASFSPVAIHQGEKKKGSSILDEEERAQPRAIVDINQNDPFGSVSYIIHPDNLPAPKYEPLKQEDTGIIKQPHPGSDLDQYMKGCCPTTGDNIGHEKDVLPKNNNIEENNFKDDDSKNLPQDEIPSNNDNNSNQDNEISTTEEMLDTTVIPLRKGEQPTEDLPVPMRLIGMKNQSNKPTDEDLAEHELLFQQELDKLKLFDFSLLDNDSLKAGNISLPFLLEGSHTPRYEDSSGISSFLKDIASSQGFQSAFLGDLIKSFGSLDANALKLIYSLLIKPLSESRPTVKSKQDRVGLAPTNYQGPQPIQRPQNSRHNIVLDNDRLPLRDQPENGWDIFPSRKPWGTKKDSNLQPSSLHSVNIVSRGRPSGPPQVSSFEDTWLPRPQKIPRLRSNARRDERVDVITAPPFETFEVVLGSSLNPEDKKTQQQQILLQQQQQQQQQVGPIPFHKLKLGEEMPPPEALEALPAGAFLIPPSQLFKRPPLPKITTNADGTPHIEMPLSDLMPNLPFFGKNDKRQPGPPPWLRPPAPPKASDIPPRLASFLPSFMQTKRPSAPPPRRPSAPLPSSNRRKDPNIQLPYNLSPLTGLHNPPPPRARPTGPPPPVTKLQGSTTTTPLNNNNNGLKPSRPIVKPIMNPSGINIPGPIPVPVFMPDSLRPVIVPTTLAPINNEIDRVDETINTDSEYSQDVPPVQSYPALAATDQHQDYPVQPGSDQQMQGTPSPHVIDDNSHYSDDKIMPTSTEIAYVASDPNKDFSSNNDQFIPGVNEGFNEYPEDSIYYHEIPPEYAYYDDYYDGRETQYYYDTGTNPRYEYDQNPMDDYQYDNAHSNSNGFEHETHSSKMPHESSQIPLDHDYFEKPEDIQKGQDDSRLAEKEEKPEISQPEHIISNINIVNEPPQNNIRSPVQLDRPKIPGTYVRPSKNPKIIDMSQGGHPKVTVGSPNKSIHANSENNEKIEMGSEIGHMDYDSFYNEDPGTGIDNVLYPDWHSQPTFTVIEQEDNHLQVLLQNHKMANALNESNGTISELDGNSINNEESKVENGENYLNPNPSAADNFDLDASITQLWNNVQLIETPFYSENENTVTNINLTALFDEAVAVKPNLTSIDDQPFLRYDVERASVGIKDGEITFNKETIINDDRHDAKVMAYALIGACCGLAILSIVGIIVILRFKKTCGSRQIKTRTRLSGDKESLDAISHQGGDVTMAGEPGHKLGSWFTGRNEHFGSGKLRGNMALPDVHDLKRGEKGGKSSSTRDLLSISSESSRASSPHTGRFSGVDNPIRVEDEDHRSSFLHDEYRASASDLSQVAAQDLAYIPHQYQSSKSPRSRQGSPKRSHPSEQSAQSQQPKQYHYHHSESVDSEQLERAARDRQSHHGRHGTRYIHSIDSEVLSDQLDEHSRYPTDSELDERTTQYDDDDESREPSRYMSDSRELDDVVSDRRPQRSSMTSQELGDHLSRDLKQYQSREHFQDTSRSLVGVSQEVDGEGDSSRELQRSTSQVSFSRDTVQNEVFLEFDNILRQHGQFLNQENNTNLSTISRRSIHTDDTNLSVSRANTPDSIDLPDHPSPDHRGHHQERPPSPPHTPPRFSPPPPPPRPPKPGHLSPPETPSPRPSRALPQSPSHSPSQSSRQHRRRTNDEERLV